MKLSKILLSKTFLAANAVGLVGALGGCTNPVPPAQPQDIVAIEKGNIQVSDILHQVDYGVYDVGVKTHSGPEVCKASVIPFGSVPTQPILSDCRADPRGDTLFVSKITLPAGLYHAKPGEYGVALNTIRGKENCVATVISGEDLKIILGGCKPQ